MSFTAAQLAYAVKGELVGDPTVQCQGAEIDTRRCVEGKVFFALRGTHTDGHTFLDDAVACGCSAVVVTHECTLPVPVVVVQDVREALSQLAMERRSQIKLKQTIAITGSVGKTTTKELVAAMLGACTTASILSFNNDLGVPLTILDAEESDFLVCEVGANAVGEIEQLAKLIQPDISILTSVDKAHLEGFSDEGTILREKVALLESTSFGGLAVVADTIDLAGMSIPATICRVGTLDVADVRIRIGVTEDGFATLELHGKQVTLSLLGEHNARNAALAVVAADHALQQSSRSSSIEELLEIAATVQGPKGRLTKVTVGGVTFFDDTYNANPASMRSALHMFSAIEGARKVLILGDMLELGSSSPSEHRLLAHTIASNTTGDDLVVLIGGEMEVVSHLPSSVYEPIASDSAMERIASLLKPNDMVLIKGSRGLQLERIIEVKQQMKVSRH